MIRQTLSLLVILTITCLAFAQADTPTIDTHQVTRYATGDSAADTDQPLAYGEIADDATGAVRVDVVASRDSLNLSRPEAEAVHDLLGHMLALSATDSTQPTEVTTPAPATPDDTTADPSGNATDPPAVTPAEPSSEASTKKPFLGMNLADVTYYSRAWVFTDLMLQSDAWRKGGSGHIFKTGYAPPGLYICTWSGSGSIRFNGDAKAQPAGSNSARVTISTGNHGIDLRKTGTVADVSLLRIEHETRISPFQPEYLESLAPFKVVRFMDWANTNNSAHKRWTSRSRKGQVTQAGSGGVAIEYMIAIANELGADPWFCIPHQADDEYIRRHAEIVRDRLTPDAKIYLEYSNEIWNTQFKQHDYIRQLGDGETYSDAFFDVWAERSRNTFKIWSEVFGDDASKRLVRVAAVHLQNPWIAQKLLPKLNGEFDAVAPSTYFGITRKQAKTLTAASTTAQILDLCEQNIRHDNEDWYNKHGQMARDWSGKIGRTIRLVSYEGGQHLTAHGDDNLPYYDQLIRAQSHARMYGLYLINMRLFEKAGGDLFVAFNDVSQPGKFGSWGHLEYQTQPIADSPKQRALLEYPPLSEQPSP